MPTRWNGRSSAAGRCSATPTPRPGSDVAARTLAGARRIIDPVWGGMFQYSDKIDWSGPHFEKLLNIQRDAMRAYVLA